MEGPHIPALEEEGEPMEEESEHNGEREEGGMKASSPTGSTTDEDTDEDSEPEPPQVIRRKVSFADAFGLNLVSVKEFDNPEVPELDVSQPPENEATHPFEEFSMSCLFTVPSSPEELDQRLQEQMVELENIELLPGTATLRGNVRVVNLCYSKAVYARVTLDRWTNHFDLSAEYVPGSSDRKTDRFTFKYTLGPPFERGGTRVEICLRYETSVGTFWANNKEMNYVLFCHRKGHAKEHGPQVQEESIGYRSKRSCLKANRRGAAEEKTRETSNPSTAAADAEATLEAEEANRKHSTDVQSLLYQEEHKPLVESIKSRHRAARMARVQDYLSQRRQQVSKAYSARGQRVPRPSPTPWGDSAGFLHKRQKKQSNESPQVLTYHQIPLLTLDWNSDKDHQWGAADMDDVWTGRAKMTLSKASEGDIEDAASVGDVWGTFGNGTDDTADKKTSVCDVWQAFLNGPSCADHSAVPESEWLQTAALVSPSNDKEPNAQYVASSQEHEFQVGADATSHAHTSALCQLLSDACQTASANVAANAEDHHPAAACVDSPRDDNTATQDASQRSPTESVTDTLREFCLRGATPVSEGDADSSTECHKRAIGEREREGKAEGVGRDEPLAPHAADLVTSSGESETTDMTAMPESQNATAVDRISRGARPDEGLSSSSRGGEVTGSAHNVTDDTLAFRGTIVKGTKDGEVFVFSASRQGAEEGSDCTGNEGATDEEIFRPRETEECEISQRYAGEKQREEFRPNRNSENPLQENESDKKGIRLADESDSSRTSFRQSKIRASEFKLEESEREDVASNDKDLEVDKKTEVEPCFCTAINKIKTPIGAGEGISQVLNEEHYDKALQRNSSRQRGNTSITSEVHNKQSRSIKAGEEERVEKSEDSTLTQMQGNAAESETDEQALVSNQSEEGKGSSCDGIIEKQQGINPAAQSRQTEESREMKKVFQGDHDTFRASEVVQTRWTHSRDDTGGQEEDEGRELSPEEATAKKNVAKRDTSAEPQHRPETLERTEADVSQRDERVSIGKLKIEVLGESTGSAESARGETENAPAESKEQELSAEVESSPRVKCNKLSEGTKDPITAENAAALEVMESGWEEMFIERFGDDLVRGIWEEVFGRKDRASNRDTDTVDGMGGELADVPDITRECHHPFEKDFSDGVFSLTDLPRDPNVSLCQGLEQTLATESNEYSPKESLTTAEQTHFLSEPLNSRAHLGQDFTPMLAVQGRPSSTVSAQSSPKDQQSYTEIQERSVTRQDTGRQLEDRVVTHRESFNPSAHTSHKHLSSSSDTLKESNSVVWWSALCVLSPLCILLVAGFFFIVFLYDFPTFFALYTFSLCWWFYKWKRHRGMKDKGMEG